LKFQKKLDYLFFIGNILPSRASVRPPCNTPGALTMCYRFVAGCVLFAVLVLCIHSVTLAQPPATNSVTITIDTSNKGKIIASGTYTTKPNVTLKEVIVWAYPVAGGVMPPQTKSAGVAKVGGDLLMLHGSFPKRCAGSEFRFQGDFALVQH
jgi:hypothetical protein